MYVIIFTDKVTNSMKRAKVRAKGEIEAMEILRATWANPIEILNIKDYKERK